MVCMGWFGMVGVFESGVVSVWLWFGYGSSIL